MRKVALLTGASGFVGANLARRLLDDGHEVHALIRSDHGQWRIAAIQDSLRIHRVDLLDRDAVAILVRQVKPDWVFHLATYGAYPHQLDLERMIKTNVLGTIGLVEACRVTGFEAFINTGSSSEYGFKNHAPTETEWLEPNSHYAVTKASATLFCRYTAQADSLPLTTLRLYSVFGPFEEPGRLMPTVVLRGLQGSLPGLVDPDVARDYVFVEDVSDAFILASSRPSAEPGAVYNVGLGVQISLRQVVDIARRIMGIRAEPQWGTMPKRSWDTSTWVADSQKLRAAGWRPRYRLEDGLRKLVDWFQRNPEVCEVYERAAASLKAPLTASGNDK